MTTLQSLYIDCEHESIKPTPQGSKKAFSRKGSTKVALVEMAKSLPAYRKALVEAIQHSMAIRGGGGGLPSRMRCNRYRDVLLQSSEIQ